MPCFTVDWFTTSMPHIHRSIGERRVQRILEIGSFEGRSTCWFLDTFPDARVTCVDTFAGSIEHAEAGMDVSDLYERFLENTKPYGDRETVLRGPSNVMLHGLAAKSFDVVYLDGSHEASDVLSDLVMAVGLLRPGGVLLIDDYNQSAFPGIRQVVDFVRDVWSARLECIHAGYQIHFLLRE